MTEEELLALISSSPAGIRGAQNAPLASTRTPLANIEASAPPAYRVPLMRAGGGMDYAYPGFGIDPERNPGVPLEMLNGGGGSGAPAPAASGIDINALLAGLGGSGIPAGGGGGGGSGGGLAGLAGGAGLTVAALGALLKVAPWLARQLGLTEQQAAAVGALPAGSYDQFATDLAANAGMQGITPTLGVTDPLPLGQMAPDLGPINDLVPPPQDGQFAGLNDYASNPDTTYQMNVSDAASGALGGGGFSIPDTILPTPAYDAILGAANAAPMPDTGFNPIGTLPDEAYVNLASQGGDAAAGGGFGGPLIDPASLGIPDASFDLMGFNIDPFSIAGGAIGSFAGGKMAEASVRGDEQQGWASKLGGLGGGAIGSLILPGIGTLIGSLLGSNIAGQLGAGEPDDPFAAFDGQVFYGDQAPGFSLGGVYTSNGGRGGPAEELRSWLLNQINQRAAAEGLVANPEMVNQSGFSAGFEYRPGYNDPLFYRWREPGAGARPDDATWRGTNDATGRQGLLDQAWGDLSSKGFFARPGTTASWQDVKTNLQGDASGEGRNLWSGGEAGDFEIPDSGKPAEQRTYAPHWATGQVQETRGGFGGEKGYTTWEESGGGEAGTFQTPIWHAGPPPAPTPMPETQQAAPLPEPMNYDQGGAAREGGLIPPTPGGTQPVPIKAHTGEFVIRPEAVAKFGPGMLTAINRGTFPHEMPDDDETDVVDGMEDEMEGYGHEQAEGESEYAGFDAFTRPYADVEDGGPSPFERVTAEATGGDPMAALRDLPPEVQQGMLMAIGIDPMIASAWLQVLGPEYQQVIAEALKAAGAMKQQQAMAMAPPPMPGAPAAAPAPGMMG